MGRKLLLMADVGIPGAAARVALGAGFVFVLRRAHPDAGFPAAAAALAALLFGLKAFTAVARRVYPSTADVRAHLEWRRNLARFHDSYQWRKLTWFGAGIVAGAGLAGDPAGWELPLGMACLACGSAAEIVWRRKRLPLAPPQLG